MKDYIIEARGLTKDFGEFRAVDKLDLKIERGEVFGFLGPNGAGKTTSINMMVGLLQPTSGEILIDGQEVNRVEKGVIGICPQELVLWDSLTPLESLKLMGIMYDIPPKTRQRRAEKLLSDLLLTDKANTQVKDLSGGMKRRLNLALAIMHQPEIVVLDEPSEGLDPQSRRVLWSYIRSLRDDEGKTVILTTHLMDEADKLSDRIAIMDHGKLLRLDTPSNLKKEIGEGDVVDMKLSDPKMNQTVIDALTPMKNIDMAVQMDERINIRALNAVAQLPTLMEEIEGIGVKIVDLSVRQNTLEDVFIELTGSTLRE